MNDRNPSLAWSTVAIVVVALTNLVLGFALGWLAFRELVLAELEGMRGF